MTCLQCARTASWLVWANMVEISALTGLECTVPIAWDTLRAKRTRHYYRPAPGRMAFTAAFSPECASGTGQRSSD